MEVSQKVKHRSKFLVIQQFHLMLLPKRIKVGARQKLYTVYSTVRKAADVETAHLSICGMCTHGILVSHRKDWNTDTCRKEH